LKGGVSSEFPLSRGLGGEISNKYGLQKVLFIDPQIYLEGLLFFSCYEGNSAKLTTSHCISSGNYSKSCKNCYLFIFIIFLFPIISEII